MAYSQNGYRANTPSLIASYTVPGTTVRVALRAGDVSVVLLHLMARFHKTVEPLRQIDTGGYNPRSIIGGRTLSNHASGTAVDLRWNDHPMGQRGTFTTPQVRAIRAILNNDLGGVVRWGGDYKTRADEMHFEINAAPSQVARIAGALRRGPAGKPAPPRFPGLMRRGTMNSAGVRALQAKMRSRGWRRMQVDGDFGPITDDLVRQFQREKGLKVDGIVGPKTWKAIFTEPIT